MYGMTTVHSEYSDRSVCVIGLGYVGLTLAVTMAEAGFDVVGTEIRGDVLAQLLRGEPHFHEVGLRPRLIRLLRERRLRFAVHIPANHHARVYIITVGTPIDAERRVRLDMIERASREVAEHLQPGDLVILRSTVKVGATRAVVEPILQTTGVQFDLAFCPERTLEGQALAELHRLPQIVGGCTAAATIRAAQLFHFLTPTVIRVDDAETAEMIKLVDNTYRDVSLAYANEVARMCDAIGIRAVEVIEAGKLGYARTNIPLPGPVGGPCLEKDPYILAEALRERGYEPELALAARRINERQPEEVAAFIAQRTSALDGFPDAPVITLLGIAFKGRPPTDDLRGTMARWVHRALQHRFPKATFRGYDPIAQPDAVRTLGLEASPTLDDAVAGAHLVVIMNNHPVFTELHFPMLVARVGRPAFIYDFWNVFFGQELDLPSGVGYAALGAHSHTIYSRIPERSAAMAVVCDR